MAAPEVHAKNKLEPSDVGKAIGARARFFVNPEARLEAGILVVEQGPARRAVIPVGEIAALAAAKPHEFRQRKSIARYLQNSREPAVLIDLRQPIPVLLDKLKVVSSVAVEVVDPRTFLESLARATGIEPDYISLESPAQRLSPR
jgi:hypothetical protein